jgi:hypothetical protein
MATSRAANPRFHIVIAEPGSMKSNAILWLASQDLKSPTQASGLL